MRDGKYDQASGTCGLSHRFTGRWEGVDILIPPGLSAPGTPQIISTITNDYDYYAITVARISLNDRYAPRRTLIRVLADAGFDSPNPTTTATPYYDHQGIDFSTANEWYYIRVNGVLAPPLQDDTLRENFLPGYDEARQKFSNGQPN